MSRARAGARVTARVELAAVGRAYPAPPNAPSEGTRCPWSATASSSERASAITAELCGPRKGSGGGSRCNLSSGGQSYRSWPSIHHIGLACACSAHTGPSRPRYERLERQNQLATAFSLALAIMALWKTHRLVTGRHPHREVRITPYKYRYTSAYILRITDHT